MPALLRFWLQSWLYALPALPLPLPAYESHEALLPRSFGGDPAPLDAPVAAGDYVLPLLSLETKIQLYYNSPPAAEVGEACYASGVSSY